MHNQWDTSRHDKLRALRNLSSSKGQMVSVLLHELEVHLPEDLPREVGDRIPDAVRGLLGRPNEPMLERRWAREYLLDALWEVGVDWAATFAEDVVAEAEALVKETKRQTATGGGE